MEQQSSVKERLERAVKVPCSKRRASKTKKVKAERTMYFLKVVFEIVLRLFLNAIIGG